MRHNYKNSLTADQRAELTSLSSKTSAEYRLVIRALIILLADQGLNNRQIAAKVGRSKRTVIKWKKRFFKHSIFCLYIDDPINELD
jgi:DNA-binding NarL/FixJ family response regulator